MSSPFPGMDPYLEHPEFWPEVHHRLITAIAIALGPLLRPKYQVAIEKRIYLSNNEDSVLVGLPDAIVFSNREMLHSPIVAPVRESDRPAPIAVQLPLVEEVQESYLEIREAGTGYVITAIELLSPKNKRSGEGQRVYERKRQHLLASLTHLVEIDLLRSGEKMPILGNVPPADYHILIGRSDRRPHADLYAFNLRSSIPSFPLPLIAGDDSPTLDLQHLFNQVYDQASYDLRVDYTQPIIPPLSPEDLDWVKSLLERQSINNA